MRKLENIVMTLATDPVWRPNHRNRATLLRWHPEPAPAAG